MELCSPVDFINPHTKHYIHIIYAFTVFDANNSNIMIGANGCII